MTPNSQCWLRGSWRGRTFKIFIPQTPRKLSLRVPCSGRNGYCRLDHCWKLHQELPLVEGILQDYCLILVNLDPITGSLSSVQSLSRVWLCNPMNCSTPGLPVHHQLQESTQIHVHWVSDAIQPSHPLLSPSPPAPNPSQHQGLFKCVSSSHQVVKVLEFQLQHQSFQWTPRTDLL